MKRTLEEISIIYALQKHGIKTEDGLPLDLLKDHRFMLDVYHDMASLKRDIVGLKAAQITFTTTATNAALWIAKNRRIDIIYTLPTFDDIRHFSGGKVNRIIAQNPIYQQWVPNKDTMEQKVVGQNIINFRGTHQPKAATMISSDLNIYDEVDSSNQEVIEQYATRLQHSTLKRQWWFSHPSVTGEGIDKKWQLSDQKHWFVQCSCGKWQYLEWPHSFNLEKKIYQCRYCHAEITNRMRRRGKWIAKYKNRALSGYWIPLFLMGQVTAAEVIEYYETKPRDYFYNKVLGLPYLGGGNKILQQEIFQNLTKERHHLGRRLVMGVDTGEDIRWVVGNKAQGLARYGESKGYDVVERFLTDSKDGIVVMDEGGDITAPRALRAKYRGRVFLCHYQRDRKTLQLIRWGDNDEYGHVTVDRNRMIDYVADKFRERKIPLHYLQDPEEWYDYWLHWSHMYRVAEENKSTHSIEYKWMRSDRDDWAHATIYWSVGIERFGGVGSIETPYPVVPRSESVIDGKIMMPKVMKDFVDRKGFIDREEGGDWRG